MRSSRLASIAALAGLVGVAPAVTSPNPTTVAAAAQGSNKAPATPAPTIAGANFIREMSRGFSLYSYAKPPIWNGVAKRGNRKGRSRWNYNR